MTDVRDDGFLRLEELEYLARKVNQILTYQQPQDGTKVILAIDLERIAYVLSRSIEEVQRREAR